MLYTVQVYSVNIANNMQVYLHVCVLYTEQKLPENGDMIQRADRQPLNISRAFMYCNSFKSYVLQLSLCHVCIHSCLHAFVHVCIYVNCVSRSVSSENECAFCCIEWSHFL